MSFVHHYADFVAFMLPIHTLGQLSVRQSAGVHACWGKEARKLYTKNHLRHLHPSHHSNFGRLRCITGVCLIKHSFPCIHECSGKKSKDQTNMVSDENLFGVTIFPGFTEHKVS